MLKYKRRPLEIDAAQWWPGSSHEVHTDSMGIEYKVYKHGVYELSEGQLYDMGARFVNPVRSIIVVDTSDGRHEITPGDWVVRCNGRVDVVSDDEFQRLYEPVG